MSMMQTSRQQQRTSATSGEECNSWLGEFGLELCSNAVESVVHAFGCPGVYGGPLDSLCAEHVGCPTPRIRLANLCA